MGRPAYRSLTTASWKRNFSLHAPFPPADEMRPTGDETLGPVSLALVRWGRRRQSHGGDLVFGARRHGVTPTGGEGVDAAGGEVEGTEDLARRHAVGGAGDQPGLAVAALHHDGVA